MLSLDDVQEILRIPLIGVIPESEAVLQASNQGTPAIHEGQRRGRGLQGRGRALPGRGAGRCASSTPQKPGFFKRLFGGGKPMGPSCPSCSARRRRPPRSPRNACRSSWRTSAAAATPRSPDYLPALQRELLAVISQVRVRSTRRHQGQPRAPGQPGSAGGEDRAAGGSVATRT